MGGRSAQIVLIACIKNRGHGLAKYPLLGLNVAKPLVVSRYGLDGNGRTGLPARVRNPWEHDWHRFAGGANDAIHSGSILEVTQIEVQIGESDAVLDDPTIEYEFGCEGVPLTRGTLTLSGKDILKEAHDAIRNWKV